MTGATVSVLKSLTSQLLGKAGVGVAPFGTMGSALMLGNKGRLYRVLHGRPKAAELVLGYITDALVGGAFGASICRFVQSETPPGHEVLKGMGAGALLAVGTLSTGRLLEIEAISHLTPEECLTTIAIGALYGAGEGFVMGRYGSSMIVQSHPIIVDQMNTREFSKRRLATGPSER